MPRFEDMLGDQPPHSEDAPLVAGRRCTPSAGLPRCGVLDCSAKSRAREIKRKLPAALCLSPFGMLSLADQQHVFRDNLAWSNEISHKRQRLQEVACWPEMRCAIPTPLISGLLAKRMD